MYFVYPDSRVHGATMRPIWGRQDPDGPHVGPMDFALWVHLEKVNRFPLVDIQPTRKHTEMFLHHNAPNETVVILTSDTRI